MKSLLNCCNTVHVSATMGFWCCVQRHKSRGNRNTYPAAWRIPLCHISYLSVHLTSNISPKLLLAFNMDLKWTVALKFQLTVLQFELGVYDKIFCCFSAFSPSPFVLWNSMLHLKVYLVYSTERGHLDVSSQTTVFCINPGLGPFELCQLPCSQ